MKVTDCGGGGQRAGACCTATFNGNLTDPRRSAGSSCSQPLLVVVTSTCPVVVCRKRIRMYMCECGAITASIFICCSFQIVVLFIGEQHALHAPRRIV